MESEIDPEDELVELYITEDLVDPMIEDVAVEAVTELDAENK